MELILSLIGITGALFAVIFFQRKQINTDKAELSILDFKKKDDDLQVLNQVSDSLLNNETQVRDKIVSDASNEEKKDVSNEELVNFFNDQLGSDK